MGKARLSASPHGQDGLCGGSSAHACTVGGLHRAPCEPLGTCTQPWLVVSRRISLFGKSSTFAPDHGGIGSARVPHKKGCLVHARGAGSPFARRALIFSGRATPMCICTRFRRFVPTTGKNQTDFLETLAVVPRLSILTTTLARGRFYVEGTGTGLAKFGPRQPRIAFKRDPAGAAAGSRRLCSSAPCGRGWVVGRRARQKISPLVAESASNGRIKASKTHLDQGTRVFSLFFKRKKESVQNRPK